MKISLFFWLFVIAFSSCTTTRFISSEVKPSEISDLQIFEPVSRISLIEKGNKTKFNDTLSEDSKDLIIKVSTSLSDQIPITGKYEITDSIIKHRLDREIEQMFLSAMNKRKNVNIALSPTVDSLLKSNGKRFGLLTVSSGFKREKGNYGKQIAKGVGIGILTMGMYYEVPYKSNSAIYAMIVDSQQKNMVFFNNSVLIDKDPLDEDTLRKQFQNIFKGYFFARE